MGQDKARLPVEAHLLVEEVAATVASITGNVALVGESQRYRDLSWDLIDDLHPCCGPLGGIQAALASRRGYWNAVVACDMPGLNSACLAELIHKAHDPNASRCLVCRDVTGRVHPLCSLWRADCLPVVELALIRGRLRLFDVLDDLNAGYVDMTERIHNVNTPDEWAAWRKHHLTEALGPR
jgi:molybdopterin-guanine dinucleotide biosynthesis protein A